MAEAPKKLTIPPPKPQHLKQEIPKEHPPPPPEEPQDIKNSTISTKASTDQLICKTPRESPNASVVKVLTDIPEAAKSCCNVVLYLGIMQILFGLLMSVFGVLVILHDASLSQIGGGLWGGSLAVGAGTAGILAAAKQWCPLKTGAQKVAQTIFLALSLVSLAISQLVLVLAATGLARDVQKTEIIEINSENAPGPEDIVEVLPSNYPALLSNIGLLVVSAIECVCAAVASYKGARIVCPCFRSAEESFYDERKIPGSEALVSSWLGKHTPPPHIYLVHAPSTLGKHSKMSGGLPVTPVFALPQQVMGPPVYPLIPAPLGHVPSPIIPARPRDVHRHYRRYLREKHPMQQQQQQVRRSKSSCSRSRSQSKEKAITTEDVAKTYTGLDRTIAEEFIEICDSRNNSLCSDSSCRSSSQSGCTGCTSDLGSRDYLIDKI